MGRPRTKANKTEKKRFAAPCKTERAPESRPEKFWQDWEVTSDEDVYRDTYGPIRLHELDQALTRE